MHAVLVALSNCQQSIDQSSPSHGQKWSSRMRTSTGRTARRRCLKLEWTQSPMRSRTAVCAWIHVRVCVMMWWCGWCVFGWTDLDEMVWVIWMKWFGWDGCDDVDDASLDEMIWMIWFGWFGWNDLDDLCLDAMSWVSWILWCLHMCWCLDCLYVLVFVLPRTSVHSA